MCFFKEIKIYQKLIKFGRIQSKKIKKDKLYGLFPLIDIKVIFLSLNRQLVKFNEKVIKFDQIQSKKTKNDLKSK